MSVELLHVIDDVLSSVERAALIMKEGKNIAGLRALCLGFAEKPSKIEGADIDTLYALIKESCLDTTALLQEITFASTNQ
jgi:hypothetical protein